MVIKGSGKKGPITNRGGEVGPKRGGEKEGPEWGEGWKNKGNVGIGSE